jgi:hypothetical protein
MKKGMERDRKEGLKKVLEKGKIEMVKRLH